MLRLWDFTNILLEENKLEINSIPSATWRVVYKDYLMYPFFEQATYFLGRNK